MSETITSLQNPVIKMAISLKQKKYRDELGLFIVEGVRLCEELAASDWESETCFFTDAAAENERTGNVLQTLTKKNCRMIQVPQTLIAKISDTEMPQGIIVLARKKLFSVNSILAAKNPLIIILDDIQDPGNIGSIIRTADASGCTSVILTKNCADLFSGKTVRSTMGSLFHFPIIEWRRKELIEILAKAKISLVATALDDAQLYHKADLTKPIAIVLGNEGRGICIEFLEKADFKLTIPLYGKAESLNVSAAAAVIMYEAARQRTL